MILGLAIALTSLAGCTDDSLTDPPVAVVRAEEPWRSVSVRDLTVEATTQSSTTLEWTQVDDGTGNPAWYRVKYATPKIDWRTATIGCDRTLKGDRIGAPMTCEVEGLDEDTAYEFQLMSYRVVNGRWRGARYSNVAAGTTQAAAAPGDADAVADLAVVAATDASLTASWTQVDDGTGQPASYRLKYAGPPIDWSSATVGCNPTLGGTQIGSPMSCTIQGLSAASDYELQLMSYRTVNGVWQGAVYSNVAAGTTQASASPPPPSSGIWIGAAELAALPASGPAWNNLLSEANSSCGSVDLTDQNQSTNVCVMAKALAFARTGNGSYRADVVTALTQIVTAPAYDGRALSLGRELGAYVISADLIDLPNHDPALDALFRTALRTLRTTYTWGAADDLVDCHEKRPNNWGAHCGATRAAIAVYLGDDADLARTAQVFKGYLGDRASYAGFSYGGPSRDLSWQCDPTRPVGINPAGCTRNGLSIDGVLPDDQRRGGSFTTSPPKENYVWEGLQGLLAQAVILYRAGYPVWDWEDRALLRAVEWLHEVVDYPAQGDDTWQPHVVNHYYGTSFPAAVPARAGKNVGWTDWTHR